MEISDEECLLILKGLIGESFDINEHREYYINHNYNAMNDGSIFTRRCGQKYLELDKEFKNKINNGKGRSCYDKIMDYGYEKRKHFREIISFDDGKSNTDNHILFTSMLGGKFKIRESNLLSFIGYYWLLYNNKCYGRFHRNKSKSDYFNNLQKYYFLVEHYKNLVRPYIDLDSDDGEISQEFCDYISKLFMHKFKNHFTRDGQTYNNDQSLIKDYYIFRNKTNGEKKVHIYFPNIIITKDDLVALVKNIRDDVTTQGRFKLEGGNIDCSYSMLRIPYSGKKGNFKSIYTPMGENPSLLQFITCFSLFLVTPFPFNTPSRYVSDGKLIKEDMLIKNEYFEIGDNDRDNILDKVSEILGTSSVTIDGKGGINGRYICPLHNRRHKSNRCKVFKTQNGIFLGCYDEDSCKPILLLETAAKDDEEELDKKDELVEKYKIPITNRLTQHFQDFEISEYREIITQENCLIHKKKQCDMSIDVEIKGNFLTFFISCTGGIQTRKILSVNDNLNSDPIVHTEDEIREKYNYIEGLGIKYKLEYVNSKYLCELDPSKEVQVVRSDQGTGKTTQMLNYIYNHLVMDKKIVIVSSRISWSKSAHKRIKKMVTKKKLEKTITLYNNPTTFKKKSKKTFHDEEDESIEGDGNRIDGDVIVISVESFFKLTDKFIDVVIIDEVSTALREIDSPHNRKNYNINCKMLAETITHCQNLLLLDAVIEENVWMLLQWFKPNDKVHFVYNSYQRCKGQTVYEIVGDKDLTSFYSLIYKHVQDGEKVCIALGSRDVGLKIEQWLIEENIGYIFCHKNSENNVEGKECDDIQVLMYTSTISVGIDIQSEFNTRFIYATSRSITSDELMQLIERTRNVTGDTYIIFPSFTERENLPCTFDSVVSHFNNVAIKSRDTTLDMMKNNSILQSKYNNNGRVWELNMDNFYTLNFLNNVLNANIDKCRYKTMVRQKLLEKGYSYRQYIPCESHFTNEELSAYKERVNENKKQEEIFTLSQVLELRNGIKDAIEEKGNDLEEEEKESMLKEQVDDKIGSSDKKEFLINVIDKIEETTQEKVVVEEEKETGNGEGDEDKSTYNVDDKVLNYYRDCNTHFVELRNCLVERNIIKGKYTIEDINVDYDKNIKENNSNYYYPLYLKLAKIKELCDILGIKSSCDRNSKIYKSVIASNVITLQNLGLRSVFNINSRYKKDNKQSAVRSVTFTLKSVFKKFNGSNMKKHGDHYMLEEAFKGFDAMIDCSKDIFKKDFVSSISEERKRKRQIKRILGIISKKELEIS